MAKRPVLMEPDDVDADRRVTAVLESIRSYLRVRPQAADTVEGIHQWWVEWGETEQSPATTEIALHRLEEQGEMEAIDIGGRQVWRARRRTGPAD